MCPNVTIDLLPGILLRDLKASILKCDHREGLGLCPHLCGRTEPNLVNYQHFELTNPLSRHFPDSTELLPASSLLLHSPLKHLVTSAQDRTGLRSFLYCQ